MCRPRGRNRSRRAVYLKVNRVLSVSSFELLKLQLKSLSVYMKLWKNRVAFESYIPKTHVVTIIVNKFSLMESGFICIGARHIFFVGGCNGISRAGSALLKK